MTPGVYGPVLAQQGMSYARNQIRADAKAQDRVAVLAVGWDAAVKQELCLGKEGVVGWEIGDDMVSQRAQIAHRHAVASGRPAAGIDKS